MISEEGAKAVSDLQVAVVVPCYNEEATVAKVVSDFQARLSEARIYVIDNNSTDATARCASAAGATVIGEKRQGKGYAIQRMFETIDADIYIMVDGDDTYPADDAQNLIAEVAEGRADMAIGNRSDALPKSEMSTIRRFGNWMIGALFNQLFHASFKDVLSGYRAMNREFVLNLPLLSAGCEIELNVQALVRGYAVVEIPIGYRERPEGSVSKLNAFRDGHRILRTLGTLLIYHRPMPFFGLLSLLSAAVGAIIWGIVPSASAGAQIGIGLIGCAVLSFALGFVLNALNMRFQEIHAVVRRHAMRGDRIR